MKAIIYLRTSTEDQQPENQKKDCLEFAKNKGYEVTEVLLEQLSGFKQIERPEYEKAKEKARKGEIQAVIVWAFDRWVRNRDTMLEDATILKNYGCKLHSVQDAWIESINIEGPLGRTIQEFMLGMMASIAEMESQRKSERVKLAVRRLDDKPTMSYKGNKWGRKGLSKQVINKVLDIKKNEPNLSIREIAAKGITYYDKNNNEKKLSRSAVHKILTDNLTKLSVKEFVNEPI